MSRHDFDYSLPIGREEIDLSITYDFEAGYKGDHIDPPESPSATIIKIEMTVDGTKVVAPDWLFRLVERDDDIHSELVHDAANDDGDPDYERDLRREVA